MNVTNSVYYCISITSYMITSLYYDYTAMRVIIHLHVYKRYVIRHLLIKILKNLNHVYFILKYNYRYYIGDRYILFKIHLHTHIYNVSRYL